MKEIRKIEKNGVGNPFCQCLNQGKGFRFVLFTVLMVFSVTLNLNYSYAQPDSGNSELEALARQLAKLENDVQLLYDDVKNKTENLRNQDRIFQARKAEVQADIQRKNLRLKQVNQELDKQTELLKSQSEQNRDILPVVFKGISVLRDYINTSLPFKRDERLSQLDDLESKLNPEKPVLLPERALNTLWAYYEDEIRLNKEHGIYKQTVRLDNQNVLSDVVKVGMIGMFYRAPDGRYGVISQRDGGGGWTISSLESEGQREDVTILMDAFVKQIRTGYFELPNFLPAEEGSK